MSENLNVKNIQLPPAPDPQGILMQLTNRYQELSPQLQIAARYIIDHPREVGLHSMRTLATNAKVHPNSFVRLAQVLGFAGYDALRERFRDFMRTGMGSSTDRIHWLQSMQKSGGSSMIIGAMADSCLENLETMFINQSVDLLEKAIEILNNSKRVYVLGLGMAYPLAYTFWYLCKMAFDKYTLIPSHGLLPTDELLRSSKNDVLLAMTFQPYRVETINAIKKAKENNTYTIGITDSTASHVYRQVDLGLVSPTHTPQFSQSNAALQALIETMCALLVSRGGSRARKAIEESLASRWNEKIYQQF